MGFSTSNRAILTNCKCNCLYAIALCEERGISFVRAPDVRIPTVVSCLVNTLSLADPRGSREGEG